MLSEVGGLGNLITENQKKKILLILIALVALGFFEVLGVGSIGPFVGVVMKSQNQAELNYLSAISKFIGTENLQNQPLILGFITISLFGLMNFFKLFTLWFESRFVWDNQAQLSICILEKILRQDYAKQQGGHTSELARNILNETQLFSSGVLLPLMHLVTYVVIVVSLVGVMSFYSPRYTIYLCLTVVFTYSFMYLIVIKPLRSKGLNALAATKDRFKIAIEALQNLKIIKVYGREDYVLRKYTKPALNYAKSLSYHHFIKGVPKQLFELLAIVGVVIVSTSYSDGGQSIVQIIPTASVFLLACYRIIPALLNIFQSIIQIKFNLPMMGKLIEFMNKKIPLENSNLNLCDPIKVNNKNILKLNNISFSHEGRRGEVLRNITEKISSGEFIGVVGQSGSGKTTLMDIIMGLRAPSAGSMTFNGTVIDHQNAPFFRSLIGFVPQEIGLTADTIAENIALSQVEDIDHSRLKEVCKIADIDDFIENSLSDSYNTSLLDNGKNLSGGQKQRIGIARALYNNPSILIFDEATSNLDIKTEENIMEAVSKLVQGRIVIFIAHKPSLTKYFDRIIYLK